MASKNLNRSTLSYNSHGSGSQTTSNKMDLWIRLQFSWFWVPDNIQPLERINLSCTMHYPNHIWLHRALCLWTGTSKYDQHGSNTTSRSWTTLDIQLERTHRHSPTQHQESGHIPHPSKWIVHKFLQGIALGNRRSQLHTHAHIYIYIYMYIHVIHMYSIHMSHRSTICTSQYLHPSIHACMPTYIYVIT